MTWPLGVGMWHIAAGAMGEAAASATRRTRWTHARIDAPRRNNILLQLTTEPVGVAVVLCNSGRAIHDLGSALGDLGSARGRHLGL